MCCFFCGKKMGFSPHNRGCSVCRGCGISDPTRICGMLPSSSSFPEAPLFAHPLENLDKFHLELLSGLFGWLVTRREFGNDLKSGKNCDVTVTGWGRYSHSHSHLTWIPGNAAATWICWAAPAVFPGKKSGILLGVESQARRFWVYLRFSRRLCFPGAEVADFPRGLAASPFPRRPKKSRKQHLFESNPKKKPIQRCLRASFALPWSEALPGFVSCRRIWEF